MKKTPIKKLALASESIRNLSIDRLRIVQGGRIDPSAWVGACPSEPTRCACIPV
jgi:hypothetical protein